MAKASGALHYFRNTGRLVPGRVRELGALQLERQRSALGELRVALVLGDAGLGKTRLAVELLPDVDELARGLICHSSPLGGMPLFGPWAKVLGLHAAEVGADGVCRACGSGLGGLPALARRAEIAHDASACAEALRYHFVEWIPGLLAKASADRPIIVVLDDVHQGHDVVWEMLLRLAWDFPASQLFVLATARPAELARHRTAVEVLHALEQEAMVRRIQLYPLSSEDLRELAAAVLGRDSVPSVLVEWLMVHAQGNPRFAVGLLEALVDNGADLQAPALDEVPEKVASWVRTEVARLDPPAVALAELLAVVGDLIDPDDLARITSQPIDDVALALERLVQCGMVVEQQHEQSLSYQVSPSLVREVLYTSIGGARRRMMHRRVAEALLESGQAEAAASHFVRAAQAGDGEAIDALIRMAAHAEQRGRCSLAWTTVSRLRELWARAAASSPHYDPMIGRCGALIELLAGDLAMVAAHARQAEGHHPADRSRLPVQLAARAAMAAAERGHLVEARRHLDAMTRANGRPLGILEPWYWWAEATVARAEGRLAAAAAVLERAVDGYSAMNVWALRAFVLADLAEIAVVIGDSDGAARAAASAGDNARRTGAPIHQTLYQLATAWALIGGGRQHLAARAALGAMDGFDSSGYALLAARARVAYANAVRQSDRGAAQEALRAAAAAFDACGAVVRRDQARTLLTQLESHGRCTVAAVHGPDSLTKRERQVAELAAGGYTAPQIATRLHIGVRTVETHLARSYSKLGVASKQQLVAHRAELGLAPSR
jgi:DNA-binding CsgD family transcriptional regulator